MFPPFLQDGRLRSGDMLLRIGAVSVVGMCARQAAAVLRQCGACVRLLVARPAASSGMPMPDTRQSMQVIYNSRLVNIYKTLPLLSGWLTDNAQPKLLVVES